MSTVLPIVIAGASLAGTSAAEELRKQGFDGDIVMLGAESQPPYLRPPLSKKFLTGEEHVESVWIQQREWYAAHDIQLRTGTTVSKISPRSHAVQLSEHEVVPYHRLLVTTGSRPRTLSLPGFAHPDVHYLRTIDDSERLRETLKSGGRRVAIVGSGWIGLEVAAAARQLGNDVTVFDRNAVPLSTALGEEMGAVFARTHEAHGVRILTSVSVDELVVDGGSVSGVRYNGGKFVPADVVIAGVGAVPNTELAESAGLEVDNGILVDEYLRTSDHDVFAAGDVARAWHPAARKRIRSEHWMNAIRTGQAAARSMLGVGTAFADIPYFYSDQFEIGMEYSGYGSAATGADIVVRGDVDGLKFIAFWVRDNRVVAGMNVNMWDVNAPIQDLIRRRTQVSAARLRDPAVAIDSL
ncbi:FAD-dependent oxidoreductase [soil metagenome]